MVYLPSALLLAATLVVCGGAPAMRVVKTANTGTPLLLNGGFEDARQGKPAPWVAWQKGYRLVPGEGRSRF